MSEVSHNIERAFVINLQNYVNQLLANVNYKFLYL